MKNNTNALFNIGYGLYVITTNDGNKDNGMIANAVCQLTSNPIRVSVTLNKSSYTHDTIKKTGKMNVNCLNVQAPFAVFEAFGFRSGRDTDKFAGSQIFRSENGLAVLPNYINAFMSLEVSEEIDLGTHTMFICNLGECDVINEAPTMSYTFYQTNVKPKPQTKKSSWVCSLCGYVHDEDELADDFVCPLCGHGKEFFEKQ